MRLLLHKPYRAFPELDRFSDAECARFESAARRHHRGSAALVYALIVLAAGLMCPLMGLFHAALVAALRAVAVPMIDADMVALLLSICLAVASASLGWLLIRDWWLRRIIGKQLRGAACYG